MIKGILIAIALLITVNFSAGNINARAAGETLTATPNPVVFGSPVTINGSGFHSGWNVQIEYARPSAGSFSVYTVVNSNGGFVDTQILNEVGNWTVCAIIQQGRPRLGPCVLVIVQ